MMKKLSLKIHEMAVRWNDKVSAKNPYVGNEGKFQNLAPYRYLAHLIFGRNCSTNGANQLQGLVGHS
jgi:hypothetical protein